MSLPELPRTWDQLPTPWNDACHDILKLCHLIDFVGYLAGQCAEGEDCVRLHLLWNLALRFAKRLVTEQRGGARCELEDFQAARLMSVCELG